MRVMIVGASTNREKFGNIAVRAFARQGHEVFPVNPRADVIEGLKCYHQIADVPGPIDRASLYLPPKLGTDAVRELATRGDVGELWVNPGAESAELIAEAVRLGFDPIQACSILAIGESPH
jgi:predicted CoA-binding protein